MKKKKCFESLFLFGFMSLFTPLDAQFTYSEHIGGESHRSFDPSTISSNDECSELLDLAAQGGIQFVRATEDGRYEVISTNGPIDIIS